MFYVNCFIYLFVLVFAGIVLTNVIIFIYIFGLFIDDHDIIELFKHIKDLHYVDLSSNRITYKTIARLAYPNLRRGSFSYNPLGPNTLTYLPELLRKCPQLNSLDLQSCDINNYTLQDITLREYQQYSGNNEQLIVYNFYMMKRIMIDG